MNLNGVPCESEVGKTGGMQEMHLSGRYCLKKLGVVVHELLHTLGVIHEHNRSDRDQYVTINLNNVDRYFWGNFYVAQGTDSFGYPYDYGSIMHYHSKTFSKNGAETITALRPLNVTMGQRTEMSTSDIAKLKVMYQCN